jgi:hypothetical protein
VTSKKTIGLASVVSAMAVAVQRLVQNECWCYKTLDGCAVVKVWGCCRTAQVIVCSMPSPHLLLRKLHLFRAKRRTCRNRATCDSCKLVVSRVDTLRFLALGKAQLDVAGVAASYAMKPAIKIPRYLCDGVAGLNRLESSSLCRVLCAQLFIPAAADITCKR